MDAIPPQYAWIITVLAAAFAAFERFINRKKEKRTEADNEALSMAKASKERADLMSVIAKENQKLYEDEKIEHKKTRDFWHAENGEAQKRLSEANLKVMELQDRPDLRELLTEMRLQGQALTAQGAAITKILEEIQRR